jgi:hypothetical protein
LWKAAATLPDAPRENGRELGRERDDDLMGDLAETGVRGVPLHGLVPGYAVTDPHGDLVGEVLPGELVIGGIPVVNVGPAVLVRDVANEVLPTVPRGGVIPLRASGRHNRLGPPGVEPLWRRLQLPLRPAIQERPPAGTGRGDLDAEVGDAGVVIRAQVVG